ncbi:formylglycine-generating enzyme family protein [Neisseria weaveri]|uniref:formylglycine-generating enzyme family protein n=1 Tax=Neisseria weaveri TaxID=28091 RepID=UPI0007C9CC4E|nr:formylglycine-generating enzyme family protein [Neisseria weaveri]SAY51316.1 Serine/threonine-protein kinase pkn1 [Neisseria weaveri]
MKAKKQLALLLALPCCIAAASDMAAISGGSYRPLYLKKDTPMISVKPYKLDKLPVTNADFAEFVSKNPQWQRGAVKTRQAEQGYLRHWVKEGKGFAPKAADLKKPVTNVSWFAANAYCSAQGKRLPTIDEWEFAGQASATQKNGTAEKGYNRAILDWYAEGSSRGLRNVAQGSANYWGIHDMHGLIWEWTEDFNSSLLTSNDTGNNMFCSGAATGSADPSDYAAFMRYGIRTSLQARFVLNNLGFRCAK